MATFFTFTVGLFFILLSYDLINSTAVKVHFGLIKLINLAKVCEYFRGEEIVQSHNSLDDAKMLKEVYEGCKNEKASEVDANVFMEYKEITTDQIEYEDTRFDVFCCSTKNFEEEKTKKFENLKDKSLFF